VRVAGIAATWLSKPDSIFGSSCPAGLLASGIPVTAPWQAAPLKRKESRLGQCSGMTPERVRESGTWA